MQKQHFDYLLGKRPIQIIVITLLVTLIGLVVAGSPFGRWLEEDIGLPWLFQLRGELPSPQNVAVVSIDQASAKALGLPAKPRKWPRNLHGKLVEQLTAHGATAIGFDIIFDEPKNPEHNQRFAHGMQNTDNVILFQYLKQSEIIDPRDDFLQGIQEQIVSPIDLLADQAFGLSPFPLPKVPAKVNHFLLYKESLGDMATMPVTMLQTHAREVNAELIELVNEFEPALAKDMQHVFGNNLSDRTRHQGIQNIAADYRNLFNKRPELVKQLQQRIKNKAELSDQQRKHLNSLLALYTSPRSLYLNFYGGLNTIHTIPYHKVLNSDPNNPTIDVKGRAVFVGFSEQFQPEQKDGFYSVFTEQDSGSDISGVEIIATAFANLLEQNAIRVPFGGDNIAAGGKNDILMLISWTFFITLLLRLGSGFLQIPLTLGIALLHFTVVYYSFTQHYLWLPFLIPIVIQLLLATLLTFLFKYREVQHERQNIRQAFGYHLPVNVVDQIAKGVNHVTGEGEKVHGIIMSTDAQQYTQLSEQLAPAQLHHLMNDYYETLFQPIRDNQGIISDVVGDAAMAIWASSSAQQQHHQQACLAALAAQSAIEYFNEQHPEQALPTRFGLDSGEIVMGHVGALDHYEYRAIGDIVNTASRIEGVNKQLGTRIIVSKAVLDGTEGLQSRCLGEFKLVGKQSAIELYELIGTDMSQADKQCASLHGDFANALSLFKTGQWQEAEAIFSKHEHDGPSQFYLSLCKDFRKETPKDFDGYVQLHKK